MAEIFLFYIVLIRETFGEIWYTRLKRTKLGKTNGGT